MARVGTDSASGQLLFGWDHCVQSITEILSTAIGSRVQRRSFGANIADYIDRPQNAETIIDLYVDAAIALEPREVEGRQYGEPGFVLLRTTVDAGTPGNVILLLSGVYFENGHLGDYSNPSERQIAYLVNPTNGTITVKAS